MEFRTELSIEKSLFKINHKTPVLMLGSCFSQNIGFKLQKYKFQCSINPFGTQFNPMALSYLLRCSLNCLFEKEDSMVLSHGLWVHPHFHSQLSHPNKEEALSVINKRIESTHIFLKECKFLFLTLGTSIGYVFKETGSVVANCHKIPAIHFQKGELKVDTITAEWENVLDELKSFNPDLKVVFTVSPVRHIKEGIVSNSFSKARLHVAIEDIMHKFDDVTYFPAYEWIIDDLRDYRYFENDFIHPSGFAIDYIWAKFSDVYFDKETNVINDELDKLFKDENHRPFNPDTKEFIKFLESLEMKKNDFNRRFPFLQLT